MKQVRCLECGEINIIEREDCNEDPIELYREFVVCSNQHKEKILEDYVETP